MLNEISAAQIERGIKIPERNKKRTLRYPWIHMKVGDSFLLPNREARAAAYQAGKRLGWRFTCMKTDEGYRVWRAE